MISREEALEIYQTIRDEDPFCHYSTEVLIQILQRNPAFPTNTREERERNRLEWEQFLVHVEPVIHDLHAEGVHSANANNRMDNVPKDQYERAIPILAKWLLSIDDHRTIEWLARSLCVPFAGKALPALFFRYLAMRDEPRSLARWTVALAIGCTMKPPNSNQVFAFALDHSFGQDRFPLLEEFRRLDDAERSLSTLVALQDDETIPDLVIARSMADLVDPKCREFLVHYLHHEDSSVRSEARKGLMKLDQREAKAPKQAIQPVKRPVRRASAPPGEWPKGLPHDALVYLIMNDQFEPETFAGRSAEEFLAVRGIGPKAIERMQLELKRRGLPPLTT